MTFQLMCALLLHYTTGTSELDSEYCYFLTLLHFTVMSIAKHFDTVAYQKGLSGNYV